MKIVQLVTRNCVGGVQLVARALDTGFRAAGHDSSIWYFCDSDETVSPQPNSRSLFASRLERLYYPRLLFRLARCLRNEQPDAVVAHTTNTAVPGLVLAGMCEIKKRVAVQHNPLNTYSTVARKADQVCANLGVYWRNVTVATAVTKSVAGYSIMASGRVRTIYNGLRAAPFPFSCSERLDIRRRFGLPLDKPLIVNIGRIAAQKNQSVLIPLMHHFPGSFLAIVGDGPLSTTLQRQIIESGLSKNVRMLGSQDSADVRLLLRSSDLFITPSHFEAMPMVVLEAMQESAVIVASNIEAHRELLADAGLVVPATVEGLRSAVQQLLDNAELRATLSQRAIERSRVFSEEAMVNKYLELLTEKP